MAKPRRDDRVPIDSVGPSKTGVTLGALFQKAGLAAPPRAAAVEPRPRASEPTGPSGPVTALAGVARVVVRRERKGHGGHTATVLEGLAGLDLDATAKRLKKALGCGAGVEAGAILLQGDVSERAALWLEGQGVKKVVRGN